MLRSIVVLTMGCALLLGWAQDKGIVVEFVRCYDGDTIVVELPELRDFDNAEQYDIFWQEISVRVNGIDTPEIHGKCDQERKMAKKARDIVQKMLTKAKQVRIDNIGRDKYFRIVADVYADGVDIGQLLIDQNLAVRYDGGTKTKDWCGRFKPTKRRL